MTNIRRVVKKTYPNFLDTHKCPNLLDTNREYDVETCDCTYVTFGKKGIIN